MSRFSLVAGIDNTLMLLGFFCICFLFLYLFFVFVVVFVFFSNTVCTLGGLTHSLGPTGVVLVSE